MVTYQDLLAVGDGEKERADFAKRVINEHQGSSFYRKAKTADDYDRCRNTTTMQHQKTITDIYGRKYADDFSPVHRSTSNFFNIFVTQLNQYLLGNGVTWESGNAKQKLGKDFDTRLQEAGKSALVCGESFGFWNYDHLEVLNYYSRDKGCFAPIYDEENGALAAGVHYWRVDESKPLRARLYELDGITNYMWSNDQNLHPEDKWQKIDDEAWFVPRQAYVQKTVGTEADGYEIYAGENYASLPIVPLWGNPHRESELVGMQEKIDAYDFMLNGWEDDLDNAQIYWIIKGAGGMDDPDLVRFLDRLRTVKAAAPEDGQDVQPVTVNIPVEAREKLLERLEKQLYRDAMMMNPEDIAGGAATATQIRAAYERQNVKADQFEYCVLDFLYGIMAIAGVEGEPTFTRSAIINQAEEVQTVVQAASFLSDEYVTRKILTILGDGDKTQDVLKAMDAEAMERMSNAGNEPEVEE